jgi:hypothetical protein
MSDGFELQFDFSEFAIWGDQMQAAADQLPFALSLSLNQSIVKARQVLVSSTWPQHVTVRNTNFIGASLRMDFSTKGNLTASIFDQLKHVYIQTLAVGGRLRPYKAQRLAIPLASWVTRTSRGVIAQQKPANIVARTPARALRITPRSIFVGEGGRLHLKYSLRREAAQPQRVPMYEDFIYTVSNAMRTGFADAMTKAMHSRRV